MLAWQTSRPGSLESLELRDVPVPEVGPGQMLVRVRTAAVNAADLVVMLDQPGARFVHSRSLPITPGYDFAGIVERVGPEVQGRRAGDEVFGFLPYRAHNNRGTFAEYVLAEPDEVFRKPTGISFAEAAAAATCGSTALRALQLAGEPGRGRRVLINGASGGVGSFLVQIAKAYGAEVWGTASAQNLPYLQRIGCDRALDYRTIDPAELPARFQLIADVADKWSYSRVERRIRTGGAYVAVLPSLRFVRGKVSSLLSSKSCLLVRVAPRDREFEELSRLIGSRRVKVPIHASFSMKDAREALRTFHEESIRGKVVVVVSEY
ncbi:MAG TPA: NAD(P)-dependent alcohol dehydrogenase [Rhodothermales bacterium]